MLDRAGILDNLRSVSWIASRDDREDVVARLGALLPEGDVRDPEPRERDLGEKAVTREEIVAEAEAALGAETWPAHPADDPVVPHETFELYLGAAGIIWALRRLGSSLDLDALAAEALRGYRESPNADEPASLLAGETGLLVLTRSDDDRLAELVAANERNPAWEVLWGSPGTILAAKAARARLAPPGGDPRCGGATPTGSGRSG